jgi:serine/threonine protein kinase
MIQNEKNGDIIYDLNILNSELNIQVSENNFIGKGTYGNVYYVGNIMGINSVIKINKSDGKNNDYEHEAYFYRKYNSNKLFNLSEHVDRSLPFLLDFGKTKNKIDNKIYDYMILEYVGINNLYIALKTRVVDYEEKIIYKMIFNCIYNHIISFHKSNLVYRDVSLANIVLSDEVTSFLIPKSYRFSEKISENLVNLIPKNICIKDIMENYIHKTYGKIVKFVDGGMFGDLDFIYNNSSYKRNSYLFCGDFNEFNMLDGMFAATLLYVSPFCLFNLSFIINNYKEEQMTKNIKNLVVNILKLADIWSLCIGYAIHLHDTNSVNLIYQVIVNSKIKKNPKTYSKDGFNGTNENTFNWMPFFVMNDNKILLVKELANILDPDTNLVNKEYALLRETISVIINEILSFSNLILSHSVKKILNYNLCFDENVINILYQESLKKMNLIYSIMNKYDSVLCEEIVEYAKHN